MPDPDPSPTPSGASSPKVSLNAALARLIVVQICIHACMAGIRMAAPLLALRQGYSAVAVGVLLALFSLTQVFLSIPAGRFADRHGLKRPVRISICCTVFGAVLAAVWPTYPVLCFAALLTGRQVYGWRGRIALRWTLAGFLLLILAYIGSRFVSEVVLGRV